VVDPADRQRLLETVGCAGREEGQVVAEAAAKEEQILLHQRETAAQCLRIPAFERQTADLARARMLRPHYGRVDHLLDLHSMTDPCPPLAMAGRQRKGVELAQALGLPQYVVIDDGHASGKRLRDYTFFDDAEDPRNALLIECGQHWERAAPEVAKQTTLRFLRHFGMADADFLDAHLDRAPRPPQKVIEVTATVTIGSDDFAFALPVQGLAIVPKAGTLLARDGDDEVRTPYDECVLIMPTRRPKKGETAVRLGRFVG